MHHLTPPCRRKTRLEVLTILAVLLLSGLPAAASSTDQGLLLRGSVRDLQGEAVAGAAVRLLPVRSHYWAWFPEVPVEPVAVTRSLGDGSFSIKAPSEGLWTLAIEKKGKAPMHFELQALLEDRDVQKVVLQDVKTVRLRAADPSGRPIRDAWILPPEPSFSEPPPHAWQPALVAARTGVDGAAELRVPAAYLPRTSWRVEHPLHRPGDIDLLATSPEATLALAAAVREPEGAWAAVEPRSSVPSTGLLLVPPKHRAPVSQVEEGGQAWLDETLLASAALHVLSPETGRLGPAALAHGPKTGDPGQGPTPGEAYRLSLPEPRIITGEVRDEVSREAVPGAFVWLARDRGIWTQADENGVWQLPVGQGEPLVFSVDARGYLPRTAPLSGGPDKGRHSLHVAPAASLEVAVQGPGGAPVSGLEAELWPLSLVQARNGQGLPAARLSVAPGGGSFTARKLVPSEPYEIVIRASGFAPVTRSWSPPAEGGRSTLTVTLKPANLLRGRVVAESGEPLGNVELLLVATAGPELRRQVQVGARHQAATVARAFTAADGTFRIGDLPPGPLDLVARKRGFGPSVRSGIRFSPQEPELELAAITLEPAVSLPGRVIDQEGGGIERAEIFVAHRSEIPGAGGREFAAGGGRPVAVTVAEGGFVLGDLERGRPINLQVQRAGFMPQKLEGVLASQDGPLVIALSAGGRIEGAVVDEEGRPLVGAAIGVELVDGPSPRGLAALYLDGLETATGPDGRFSLAGLPPGDLKVRGSADGHQPETQILDALGEGQRKTLTFRLQKGVLLEGVVLTAEGAAAGRATVQAGGRQIRADKAGRFRLDGLAPGRTRVTARHSTFGKAQETVEISPAGAYVELSLSASGQVVSRIVDEKDLPVEGATVRLLAGGAPLLQRTNREGTATFPLVPSSSQAVVFVEKDGYTSTRQAIQARPHESTEVTLALEPACAVEGQIIASGEERMEGVEVFASQARQATLAGTVDYRGEYRIAGLGEGSWTVVARSPEGRRGESVVECSSADRAPRADLELEAGFPLVAVVSLGGKPASGTEVQIRDGQGSIVDGGRTDHRGRFSMTGLKKGRYQVRAVSREWGVEATEGLEVPSTERIEIDLVRLSLAGNVYDSSTGDPVLGAHLKLLSQDHEAMHVVGDVTTGPEGKFNFPNVEAKDLRIAIERPGFNRVMLNIPVASLMAQPWISIPLQPAS